MLWIVIFIFILVMLAFKYANTKLVGKGAHPIGFVFIIQIFVFSLPGVLLISFFDFSSYRYRGIDYFVLERIGFWYLYSIAVIFLVNIALVYISPPRNYQKAVLLDYDEVKAKQKCNILLLLSALTVFYYLFVLPESPLLLALKGKVAEAYLLRVEYQNNFGKYNPKYITPVINFLMTFQFFYIFYCFLKHKVVGKKTLVISFVFSAVFLSLNIIKSKVLFLILIAAFMYLAFTGRYKNFLYLILFFTVVLVLSYVFTMESDIDGLFSIIYERVFIAQNQGFYHMINSIEPSSKYQWEGMFFINRFGIYPEHADVDVLPYIYNNYTNIVNSNSYFLGQAWSMFGTVGLIISPFCVGFFIYTVVKIIDKIIGYAPGFGIAYLFTFLPTLRINQKFSDFLFGREFIISLVCFAILTCLVSILSRITYKDE